MISPCSVQVKRSNFNKAESSLFLSFFKLIVFPNFKIYSSFEPNYRSLPSLPGNNVHYAIAVSFKTKKTPVFLFSEGLIVFSQFSRLKNPKTLSF